MKVIDSFTGQHAFLSNFYPCTLRGHGLEFPTVEHAFQAAKVNPADPRCEELQAQIAQAPTAKEAKQLGRSVPLHPAWEWDKFVVMEVLLEDKFAAGSKLADQLLGTGHAVLIEGNTWHDQVWGNCTCAQHTPDQGQNALGILLMKVRLDLRTATS